MRIKAIKAHDIRRFSDLTIEELPESAKLVLLIGQNGSGKSSIFDVLRKWQNGVHDSNFHGKNSAAHSDPEITFHDGEITPGKARAKAIYIRTAYRNDPDFVISSLERKGPILDEARPNRTIENDITVSSNYQRMVGETVDELYNGSADTDTVKMLREKLVGQIRDSMLRVFDDLTLKGTGNPMSDGSFFFEKGASTNFHYKNLSGGEKAAFDLILDLVIKRKEYNDTVFCIDEPDTHMHTKLQGKLLKELINLIPDGSQLWIATHSAGMMRAAMDMHSRNPGSVVFLDFHDVDFDQPVRLAPTVPDRAFWKKILAVALDDLSELIVPKQIVLCEGHLQHTATKAAFDADCLAKIFSNEFPDADFISVGNAHQVQHDSVGIGLSIEKLAAGVKVIRVIDRDDRSPNEIQDLQLKGTRVLSKRHIESYLWDDAVLTELCNSEGKPAVITALLAEKQRAIQSAISRGNPADDMKSAVGEAYIAAKKLLGLTARGNSADAFMRDVLAPLIRPGMPVYQELKNDIFGP